MQLAFFLFGFAPPYADNLTGPGTMNLHLGQSIGDVFGDADFHEISTFNEIDSGYFSGRRVPPFLPDEELAAIAALEDAEGHFIARSSTGALADRFKALTFVLGGLTGAEMRQFSHTRGLKHMRSTLQNSCQVMIYYFRRQPCLKSRERRSVDGPKAAKQYRTHLRPSLRRFLT